MLHDGMDAVHVSLSLVDNAYWHVEIRVPPLLADFVRELIQIIQLNCECYNASCRCAYASLCHCPNFNYEVIEEEAALN